jgi:hypothetical protein
MFQLPGFWNSWFELVGWVQEEGLLYNVQSHLSLLLKVTEMLMSKGVARAIKGGGGLVDRSRWPFQPCLFQFHSSRCLDKSLLIEEEFFLKFFLENDKFAPPK